MSFQPVKPVFGNDNHSSDLMLSEMTRSFNHFFSDLMLFDQKRHDCFNTQNFSRSDRKYHVISCVSHSTIL